MDNRTQFQNSINKPQDSHDKHPEKNRSYPNEDKGAAPVSKPLIVHNLSTAAVAEEVTFVDCSENSNPSGQEGAGGGAPDKKSALAQELSPEEVAAAARYALAEVVTPVDYSEKSNPADRVRTIVELLLRTCLLLLLRVSAVLWKQHWSKQSLLRRHWLRKSIPLMLRAPVVMYLPKRTLVQMLKMAVRPTVARELFWT